MKHIFGTAILSVYFGGAVVGFLDAMRIKESYLAMFWASMCLFSFCMAISITIHGIVDYYKQKEI
jgi:hypothetical protein